MITIELPCWHDGCAHVFRLALEPGWVSDNNADLVEHLTQAHGGLGVERVS